MKKASLKQRPTHHRLLTLSPPGRDKTVNTVKGIENWGEGEQTEHRGISGQEKYSECCYKDEYLLLWVFLYMCMNFCCIRITQSGMIQSATCTWIFMLSSSPKQMKNTWYFEEDCTESLKLSLVCTIHLYRIEPFKYRKWDYFSFTFFFLQ